MALGLSQEQFGECRMALGLSQEQFGDMVGKTKRTVQRWEEGGVALIPSEVKVFARALRPVRPDLAAQMAATVGTTLDELGIVPAAEASRRTAPSDAIDSVVRAAADAMGVSPDAIRPALSAAFVRALDAGLDVRCGQWSTG
jgi:transcriptional regulator with XRE-family HTH domain